MTDSVAYDQFFELCGKAFERHGDILDLPVLAHPYQYIADALKEDYPGGTILDFGCGAKSPIRQVVSISDKDYFTCDSDPSANVNFREIEDIPKEQVFDIVTSNHVFEHLPFEVGLAVGKQLAARTKPGGIMVIGVPNPKHPTRFISSPVHTTPWNYLNLCAVMELAGMDAFLCARNHKHKAPNLLMRPLIHYLCRVFMMDWCDSIYVVGRKAESE